MNRKMHITFLITSVLASQLAFADDLAQRLSVSETAVRIVVDGHDAQYPMTID